MRRRGGGSRGGFRRAPLANDANGPIVKHLESIMRDARSHNQDRKFLTYRRAAQAIKTHPQPVRTYQNALDVKYIGPTIARCIMSFLKSQGAGSQPPAVAAADLDEESETDSDSDASSGAEDLEVDSDSDSESSPLRDIRLIQAGNAAANRGRGRGRGGRRRRRRRGRTKKKKKKSPPPKKGKAKGKPKKPRVYRPRFKSAPWALLLALVQAPPSSLPMHKTILIPLAQPLTSTSLIPDSTSQTRHRANSTFAYCGWSSMGTLVKKGLVVRRRRGRESVYALSDVGQTVGSELLRRWKEVEEKMSSTASEDDDSDDEDFDGGGGGASVVVSASASVSASADAGDGFLMDDDEVVLLSQDGVDLRRQKGRSKRRRSRSPRSVAAAAAAATAVAVPHLPVTGRKRERGRGSSRRQRESPPAGTDLGPPPRKRRKKSAVRFRLTLARASFVSTEGSPVETQFESECHVDIDRGRVGFRASLSFGVVPSRRMSDADSGTRVRLVDEAIRVVVADSVVERFGSVFVDEEVGMWCCAVWVFGEDCPASSAGLGEWIRGKLGPVGGGGREESPEPFEYLLGGSGATTAAESSSSQSSSSQSQSQSQGGGGVVIADEDGEEIEMLDMLVDEEDDEEDDTDAVDVLSCDDYLTPTTGRRPAPPPLVAPRLGPYKVVLLLDKRELPRTRNQELKSKKAVLRHMEAKNVPCELAMLGVGDMAWVARLKPGHRDILASPGDPTEFMLHFVVERKDTEDLAHSIRDGRYREQRHRLVQSKMSVIWYLVEGSFSGLTLSPPALYSAVVNLVNFSPEMRLKRTRNLHESIEFLSMMTKEIQRLVDTNGYARYMYRGEKISLAQFTADMRKDANLSFTETFGRQLCCLQGMSEPKALSILEKYPTFASLADAYDRAESDRHGEKLLQDTVVKGAVAAIGTRRLGPKLSKLIFDTFNTS